MGESAQIQAILAATWHPTQWRDVRVLVAVSGGPDSVALLRALLALTHQPQHLHVAHFNHRWRGADSDDDANFVSQLCKQWDVPLHHGALAETPEPASQSEEAARNARLDFLESTAAAIGARYLATAHTADDQAETILHRILRGTGIAGLAGIQPIRPLNRLTTLVRPFLQVRRQLVLDYLHSLGQPYREDTSNHDRRYTRARLRNELIPHLEQEYNAQAREALCRMGALAGEAQTIIQRLAEELLSQAVVSRQPTEVILDCTGFLSVEPYLVREALVTLYRQQRWPLRAMAYEKWVALAQFAACPEAAPSQLELPHAMHVSRDGQQLVFRQQVAD